MVDFLLWENRVDELDIKFVKKMLCENSKENFGHILSCVSPKVSAWQLFVEISDQCRVLIFDSRLGLESMEFSKKAKLVIVLCKTLEEVYLIRDRIKSRRITNIQYVVAELPNLPFRDKSFSFASLSELSRNVGVVSRDSLKQVLSETFRVVEKEGEVFLGIDVSKRCESGKRFYERFCWFFEGQKLKSALKGLKVNIEKEIFPYPEWIRPSELLFGRKGGKIDAYQWKRIMRQLLRNIMPEFLTPVHCLLLSKDRYKRPILKKSFWEELQSKYNEIIPHVRRQKLSVERFLLCNPNVVLFEVKDKFKDYIVRVGIDNISNKRIQANVHATNLIRENFSEIRSYVPQQIGSFFIKNHLVSIEEKIDNRFLISPKKCKSYHARVALEWIMDFHRLTRRDEKLDSFKFEELIEPYLQELSLWVPARFASHIEKLREYFMKVWIEKEFPFVFMHGDFKVDNIFFEKRFSRVCYVIDWDLSNPKGFPLTDLFYFLIYNKMVDKEYVIIDIFRDIQNFNNSVSSFSPVLDAYVKDFGLEPEDIFGLAIVTWMHHILVRMGPYMKLWEPWLQRNVLDVLEIICSQLSRFAQLD